MKKKILTRLETIEAEEVVRVLYACESGSRAWGFPSADSDYDVRFVYLHPVEWYLSINLEQKPDVIERPVAGDRLDVCGWDLRKALGLLRKFNPPLMEWLGSPIVYLERSPIANEMRKLMSMYYSPLACLYHYLHMARGNYRQYLQGPTVWIKKYFYALRPILAINWIERDLGIVPTAFQSLVDQVVDSPEVKTEINNLIEAKKRGDELDRGPRIAPLSDFIDREMARLDNRQFEQEYARPQSPISAFDDVFRAALHEVWLS